MLFSRNDVHCEELSGGERVGADALEPQVQRFQPLQHEEGIEGRNAGAHIAQQRDPDLEDESHVAHARHVPERIPIHQAMVAGIRLGELGELAVVPTEVA